MEACLAPRGGTPRVARAALARARRHLVRRGAVPPAPPPRRAQPPPPPRRPPTCRSPDSRTSSFHTTGRRGEAAPTARASRPRALRGARDARTPRRDRDATTRAGERRSACHTVPHRARVVVVCPRVALKTKKLSGCERVAPGVRRRRRVYRAGRTKKRPRRTFVPVGLSTRWPYPSHPNAARLPSDARALTPRTFRCPSPRFSAAAPPFPGLRRSLPGAASRRERDPPPFRGRFLAPPSQSPPERAMRTRTPGRLARRCPWSPWAARRTRWTAR